MHVNFNIYVMGCIAQNVNSKIILFQLCRVKIPYRLQGVELASGIRTPLTELSRRKPIYILYIMINQNVLTCKLLQD